MLFIFSGSVATPSAVMTCPRKFTFFENSVHFLGLSFRPAPSADQKPIADFQASPQMIFQPQLYRPDKQDIYSTVVPPIPFLSVFQRLRRQDRMASVEIEIVPVKTQMQFSGDLSLPFPPASTPNKGLK